MLSKVWTLLKADRHSISIINTDLTKNRFKNISKNAFVVIVIASLCYCVGMYANFIAEPLYKQGQTHLMLAIMIFLSLILSVVNTIHKSQGMLFKSKDNDLLLSLPLDKMSILASRIIKLMLTQYIWSTIVLLPSLIVYVYYEGITLSFVISSIVMVISIPILPVIIGTIVGYIVTLISSRFKNKNIMQIIISVITFVVVFYVSFTYSNNLSGLLDENVYITLKKIYYPLGLYIESLESLNIVNILIILSVNLIPLLLFIVIFSFMYFNIISKLSENHSKAKYEIKRVKVHSAFDCLVSKEAKKYFRSNIYLLNTIIGPILMLVAAIWLVVKGIDLSSIVTDAASMQAITNIIPLAIYIIVTMSISTANISASSISLEGKNVALLKSLPINTSNIFLAKILFHFIVVFLPTVFSAVLLGIALDISAIDIAILVISSGLSVFMLSVIGLAINVLLPKTEASDIAIVKQSASSICSIIVGILYAMLVVYIGYKFKFQNSVAVIGICSGINLVVSYIGWMFLEKFGVKKFNDI